jgi:YD repeat-containing protein
MSQVSSLPPQPPPPIDHRPSSGLLMLYGGAALVVLVVFAIFLELRLVNSQAGKDALQKIRGDARVQEEFGADIHVPIAFGWSMGNQAWILAYLVGKKSYGNVRVGMEKVNGTFLLTELEVYNHREGHLISLSRREAAAKREDLRVPGTVYFVPFEDSAKPDAASLAEFFDHEFGISTKALPAIDPPSAAYDSQRKQWVAEMLAQAMAAKYPDVAADPDARMVGILEDDLYIRGFNWNYSYSYRDEETNSIVPTLRFDPTFYGLPENDAIRMERLRKVVMKQVALTHLGFTETSDPQSVDAVEDSIEDIDRMGTVYLAADVRTRVTAADADGTPCLTFYTANVFGLPLRKPIVPCSRHVSETETTQFQVDLARGRFQMTRNDIYRPGPVPLALQRMSFSYHFNDEIRAFGKSSWQNLDDTVWSADPNSIQTININGTVFARITPGTGFSPQAEYRAGGNAGIFSDALLFWDRNGGWRVDTRYGEVWKYLGCGPNTRVQCYFMGITTWRDDAVQIQRDRADGHIQRVLQKTNPKFGEAASNDHTLTPHYEGDRITEIDDSDGRKAQYQYDQAEYLTDVDADGHRVHYDYDDLHRIVSVNEDGHQLRVQYDSEGRPNRVDFPNGSAYSIHYSEDAIEVNGPGKSYKVSVLPTFFRINEQPNEIR